MIQCVFQYSDFAQSFFVSSYRGKYSHFMTMANQEETIMIELYHKVYKILRKLLEQQAWKGEPTTSIPALARLNITLLFSEVYSHPLQGKAAVNNCIAAQVDFLEQLLTNQSAQCSSVKHSKQSLTETDHMFSFLVIFQIFLELCD